MSRPTFQDTPGLVATLMRHGTSLIKGELSQARAEISQNLSRAGGGLALVVIAALLALVALNVLATAAVAYIAMAGLSAGLAAVIVGAVLLCVAVGLALIGKRRLSPGALVPENTIQSIRADLAAAKQATHV